MKVSQAENVLALFELFARERTPRTLTALAEQLGMPKSSTFNLIHTLLDHGFLYETRRRGGYYPTRRLLELANGIAEGDPFLQRIHSHLEALAADTGETALLAVREDLDVIYVDVKECSSPIRYTAKVGDRRPVWTASSGKAILASLPAKERGAILQALPMSAAGELSEELDAARLRGWCEDRAKTAPDVMGIGVPLVCGDRHFGLAVAGPIYRMQERRDTLARTLMATADEIGQLFAAGLPGEGRRSGGA